jgi:hypothetical protein
LPLVIFPPVIFQVIDVLSPGGICAATGLMIANPVNDKVAAPPRIANIANIAILAIDRYAISLIYKVTKS